METKESVVQDNRSMPSQEPPALHKKYHSPKLIEYGSLAELTKTSGVGTTDALVATLAG